jgi:hypothetical protein
MITGCRTALLVLVTTALAACSSAKQQTPPTQPDGHRTIAEGYSLVYAIASQQKHLDKALLVKSESDPVDAVVSELSDYAGTLSAELEDMAKRYPALTVDTQFLPAVEAKARESLTVETTKALLAAQGKDFERLLLEKQLPALESEQHIAKVMVQLETADERREFWTRTDQRLGSLRAKIERLLERNYYCD